MIYINNENKIKNRDFKNHNNFYVVTDFDKTLTAGDSVATWGVFSETGKIGEEYVVARRKLYNYYRPIEIDLTLPYEERSKQMEAWHKKHIDLFHTYGLKEEDIDSAMKERLIKYRKGAKNFLAKMKEFGVPVLIVSAGIGNIIEKFLIQENDYSDNIKILSNFIKFENGFIKSIDGEVIHSLNKNIINLNSQIKENISKRENILLLGDGISDLKMIPDKDRKRAVTIGFLDEKIKENLQYYNEEFDIVITDNGSFDDANNILNIY